MAIATGRTSGIWVLDVDPRNDGGSSLECLEREIGPVPATIEQITGGGGRHLVFAYPEGCRVRQGNHRLGRGLDVKSDGGYVVAEPSRHVSGTAYAWEASSDPLLGGTNQRGCTGAEFFPLRKANEVITAFFEIEVRIDCVGQLGSEVGR